MGESVTLAELAIFLKLAELLHFARTAEEIGVTQSRVSQVVRRLESDLGGKLFERSSRRVQITPLGEQLQRSVAPAFAQLSEALSETRLMARGVGPRMAVGLVSQSSAGGPHLSAIMDSFRRAYPECEVRLVELQLADVIGPLRRDEVDVLCLRVPVEADDLEVGPLLSDEPRVLLVAEDHELTRRAELVWEDLGDFALADVPDLAPEVLAAVLPKVTPAGRHIARGATIHNMSELLRAVAAGEIVHPTAASTTNFRRHPGTVALPITDAPPAQSALVLPREGRSTAAEAFVDLARRVLAETDLAPFITPHQ